MSRILRGERQRIANDHIEEYGTPTAASFMDKVEATGGQHPAWGWFEWDDAKAGRAHRIEQARDFFQGLHIKFSIETIEHGKVRVVEHIAPFAFSPIVNRSDGGGYKRLDPSDPIDMTQFCAEAGVALQSWLDRYSGAVAYAGGSTASTRKLVATLEQKARAEAAA